MDEAAIQLRRTERILELSRELVSTVSLERLLHKIVEAAAELTDSEAASILLFDEQADELRFIAAKSLADQLADIPVPVEGSIAGIAFSSGKPQIVHDVRADPRYYKAVEQQTGFVVYSLLAVPLQLQDRRVGVLEAENRQDGRQFTQENVETLTVLAAQATVAIENARLVEALQESRTELERRVEERTAELSSANEALWHRNRELAALNAVAEALSTSLELQEILDQALAHGIKALEFAGGLITLVSERTGDLGLVSHTGMPQSAVEHLQTHGLTDTLCDLVYRGGKTLGLEDLGQGAPVNVSRLVEMGLHAYVGAPIAYQDRVLGTFGLFHTTPHPISKTDYALLTTIGQQIGAAVENARLFSDAMREREMTRILLDTAEALSTTLRLDKLLERALDELQRVVPYDTAVIGMLRDEHWWIAASRSQERTIPKRFDLEELPLVKRVVYERGPVIASDVRQEPDWLPIEGSEWIRSWLGVPLISRDEVIGALMMNSHRPHTYDEEIARLAAVFAQHVTLAIENSRLYEQVRAKLREAQLLQSVTTALSSTLDLEQMLPYVARSLCEILNCTSAEICSLDEASDTITLIARYVAPEGTAAEMERGADLGRARTLADLPAVMEALIRRTPLQVQTNDPQADPHLLAGLKIHGAQAMLLLPMGVGDVVLGFALVWDSQAPRRFAEGEIATGQVLVHQAAITVDNARLVETLRQRTTMLQARNEELDAFAHTVAHDLKTPLSSLIGFGSLLERRFAQISEQDLRRHLQAITETGNKMNTIIDELLLLANVHKMEQVEIEPLDMAVIVAEAQNRMADLIEKHQAEVVVMEDWPVALGRGAWVEEVWVNYVSNALKYGGNPPRVELGAASPSTPPAGEKEKGGMVRFWVRDNGPGLTPEEQGRLFTPFTRLGQTKAEGYGLGLSIVRRIVERMGGQVGVESQVGQGSVFFFTLPGMSR
jgi:GAF domain-containing protein